jgi:hypothetical protein
MGMFTPPPIPPSGFTDLKMPSWDEIGNALSDGMLLGGSWDDLVNKNKASVLDFIFWGIDWAVGKVDKILALFTHWLTAMQGAGTPGFFALVGAVIGDLLGIEFDGATFQTVYAQHGIIPAMRDIGGKIYTTLQTEFSLGVVGNQLQPSTGAAQAFLGFLTSFAVRQGNVAFLTGLLPEELEIFAGLREYGEMLARNLGLGRLARRALQPLIQTLVADPLQWSLNAQYRPKLLAEAQYVKALHRGDLTRDQVNVWLSWLGYSDQAIEIAIADATRPLNPNELLELYRLQLYADADIPGLITKEGVDGKEALEIWAATKQAPVNSLVHTYLHELLAQVRGGFLDVPTFKSYLVGLPLTPDENTWWQRLVGIYAEPGWRHLSEGEIERAFLGGIIDMTAAQTYWTRLGYAADSVQTLTFLLLEKQAAGQRARGGHVPHKHLSEAQLEKAYEGGILDLAQIQAGWQNLGYSPADQQVLTALVTAKTPPPGTTTLPGVTVP